MDDIDGSAVQTYFRERKEEMTTFLSALVEAESPTDDPATQEAVFALIGDALAEAGYIVRRLPGYNSGGQLFARPVIRRRGAPMQLLLGHTDTVWPVGTLQDMPIQVRNGCLYGPGSYDMKAGLTQIVFALRAAHDLGLEPSVTPLVFLNSDEEIGSPESRLWVRRLARAALRTFVLEPSLGPAGRLKTARKGGGRFTVSITGRSAHAGLDPESGASAIVELSHVIQRLHALNDVERGISVNVGTIQGGSRPNVVAPTSRAEVDVRVRTLRDAREVEQRIQRIEPATPGVSLSIEGRIGRPPMEPTPRNRTLWEMALEAGRKLGIELQEGLAGGSSDGNEASQYSATLDGLGAVGDGAHAHHEHVSLSHLPDRTALLVLLLMAESAADRRQQEGSQEAVPHLP